MQKPPEQTTDLLEDLRGLSGFDHVGQTAIRAAEEIERLRAANAELKAERSRVIDVVRALNMEVTNRVKQVCYG